MHPDFQKEKSKHGIPAMGFDKDPEGEGYIAYLPTDYEKAENGRILLKRFKEMKMDDPEEITAYMSRFFAERIK